ncbi:MAG TPA: hypothetical protein VMW38_14245, partial [Terriglobia bacterium]|nr:hypothetical protein [Terriglobia bacterium]
MNEQRSAQDDGESLSSIGGTVGEPSSQRTSGGLISGSLSRQGMLGTLGRRLASLFIGQAGRVAIKVLPIILVFSWTLLQAGSLHAESPQWVYLGPPLGALYPLAIDIHDPSIIYSTNGQNIYKSTDRALSWQLARNGSPDTQITVMAIDPQNSLNLYVGTSNEGLLKS